MGASEPFDTRDEAARAGFRQILQNSDEWKYSEFGFWVIVKVSDHKTVKFHHTAIQSSGNHDAVKLVKPLALVRAHCHSHPSSTNTQHFSVGDIKLFTSELNNNPHSHGVAMYLLTPLEQIRLAERKTDFPTGKGVSWG